MGFFETKTDTNTTDEQRAYATSLVNTLTAIPGRVITKPSIDKWARDFATLERRGITPSEITTTLAWLAKFAKEPYTPKVYSAESFIKKYSQIRDAMSRHVDLDTDTRVAAAYLKRWGLHWPEQTIIKELPLAVQITLDTHKRYVTAIRSILNTKRAGLAVHEHIAVRLGTTACFAEWWWADVHRLAWRNGAVRWSGHPLRFAARPDAPRFVKLGEGWAMEYAGFPNAWHQLTGIVNES